MAPASIHSTRKTDAEADVAAGEAARGAVYGAAQWGFYAAALGLAGYVLSPIYRSLTIQFKVFLQISGMTVGGMIHADRQLRDYEASVRAEKRRRRERIDHEAWRRFEEGIHDGEDEARKRPAPGEE
ncbi:MAG: hypothetical protein M1832_003105 [Thelocarpon impressellum]|nr:MAG: hypothetical protein M1832_003105 [Thelocarpon impressellum]